jgi:hypothetical protein
MRALDVRATADAQIALQPPIADAGEGCIPLQNEIVRLPR